MDSPISLQTEGARDRTSTPAPISTGYAIYITFVLALVSMLAYADRNILSVLLVPIQQDLNVNDTAMGALSGVAYSLVYATVALPMARFADHGNRRTIIAAAVAFWSVMTFACGLATSYFTLLAARVGVAAGDATAQPAQTSMIGDLFSYKFRATALGFIITGTLVGLSVGSFVAGYLSDLYNWKVAFMALAAPGLIVSLLMYFTVPEPRRGVHEKNGDVEDSAAKSWRSSLAYLLSVKSMCGLIVAQMFVGVAFLGYLIWLPAFLIRVHHMSTAEMSLWYGVSMGVGAIFANLISGVISDRLARRGARWRFYLLGAMMLVSAPIVLVGVMSNYVPVVIGALILYSFAAGGSTAVGGAALLELVRPRMRGFAMAILLFSSSVVGGGFGPLLLGAFSDLMKGAYGELALRYTLLSVPIFLVASGIIFLWASRTADQDAVAAGRPGITP